MSQDFNYQEALSQCRTMEDITGKDGLVQKIIRDAVEHIPGQELEDYVSEKNNSGDKVSRNGSAKKNIKTAYYAKGMTVRDITQHLQALYGIELSATSISNITDKIFGEAKDWHCRTLDSFYPVVFPDAVHFKVREEGRIVSKAAYTAPGINGEGYKDIPGIWVGENEGAKFWLKVCNE